MWNRLLFGSFLLLATSCNTDLLTDSAKNWESRSASSLYNALTPGQIVLATQSIPLQFADTPAVSLQLKILNKFGTPLFERTYDTANLAQSFLTKSEWTSIQSAAGFSPYLRLQADLIDVKKVTKRIVVPFFLLTQVPTFSISTFPPEVEPDSQIQLEARSNYPLPYALRWDVGGKTIAFGAANDYGRVFWRSGLDRGIAQVTTDLYPDVPARPTDFDFPAPLRVTSRIAVTEHVGSFRGELGPEGSYLHLWHFRGNRNDASIGKRLTAKEGQIERWAAVNGTYAAVLAEGESWEGTQGFLPEDPTAPFSVNLFLSPTDVERDVSLIRSDTEDGNPQAEIVLLATGVPLLRLWSQDALLVEARANFSIPTTFSWVSFSVVPGNPGALFWFLNGKFKGKTELPSFAAAARRTSGKLTWKGPIQWSEVGVYVRTEDGKPSTDPEIFSRSIVSKYGSDLLFSQGFDGSAPPSGWSFPKQKSLSLAVELQPGETIVSPVFVVSSGIWALSFSARDESRGNVWLSARDDDGKTLWSSTKKTTDPLAIWDRRGQIETTCQYEWTNVGSTPLVIDELAVYRKTE